MSTSDERCEIASILRGIEGAPIDAAHVACLLGVTYLTDDAGRHVSIPVGGLHKLADLVDPTCHAVVEDETQVCSECGGDLDEGYGWNHCPRCGARVVGAN